jgi:hypothetical protein
MIRKLVEDKPSTILAFGIGCEEFFVSREWNLAVAVRISAAEAQVELMPVGVVRDCGQHLGLHWNPFHSAGPSHPLSLFPQKA